MLRPETLRPWQSLLAGACWALAWHTQAAETPPTQPESQPIQIEADRVELDHAGQTSVYRGRVRLTQAQGTLEADTITLRHRAGRIERVEAEGKPARFTQPAQPGTQAVVATSTNMRYTPASGELVLDGAGQLKQGGSLLRSEHVVYDTQARRLRAGGEGGGRVRITIEPEKLQGAPPR
jgi:lipopolysaccharide export system protein LptA